MADFSRDRFEHFRAKVEAALTDTFTGLGLAAETLDALEARLTGRITIDAGRGVLQVPIDVTCELFGDDDEDPHDFEEPDPFEAHDDGTTVDLEAEVGGVDEHRLESLRLAVAASPGGGLAEDPIATVERARRFAGFLNEGDTDG